MTCCSWLRRWRLLESYDSRRKFWGSRLGLRFSSQQKKKGNDSRLRKMRSCLHTTPPPAVLSDRLFPLPWSYFRAPWRAAQKIRGRPLRVRSSRTRPSRPVPLPAGELSIAASSAPLIRVPRSDLLSSSAKEDKRKVLIKPNILSKTVCVAEMVCKNEGEGRRC